MTEPMYRRPAHDGDEQDAFSRSARKALCALSRAGVVHSTKTRAARRTRRTTRQAMLGAGRTYADLMDGLTTGRLDLTDDYALILARVDELAEL